MNPASLSPYSPRTLRYLALTLSLLLFVLVGVAVWWNDGTHWFNSSAAWQHSTANSRRNTDAHSEDASESHDHAHGSGEGADSANEHAELNSLPFTSQALKNLGLTSDWLKPVEPRDFYRTITVPAIVVAKPGRTEIQVSSPMEGIVQHVHAVSGEAVIPEGLLFEIRLTYEELVDTQTSLLKATSDLDVENREIARLDEVTRSGAVASKQLLERQYAKQKLEGTISSLKAALKLHGLSEQQIDTITQERKLLRELSIVAPPIDSHAHDTPLRLGANPIHSVSFAQGTENVAPQIATTLTPLIVDRLVAQKGQGVKAGELLCTLSDYSSLYIEGRTFEQDAAAINEAISKEWPIEAVVLTSTGTETIQGLKVAYVNNAIDQKSRSLSFFVDLPNTVLRDTSNSSGQRFVTWKYRVGQRLDLKLPLEHWNQQYVLPVDAVVKDDLHWFVFRKSDNRFERVSVHVKYRDSYAIVVADDGVLKRTDIIAHRSAHQLQLAFKSQSASVPDAHAGHNH